MTDSLTRMAQYQDRLRAASDHLTRWDLICEVGMYPHGTVADCEALHKWACSQWPDFPKTPAECRRVFEAESPISKGPTRRMEDVDDKLPF